MFKKVWVIGLILLFVLGMTSIAFAAQGSGNGNQSQNQNQNGDCTGDCSGDCGDGPCEPDGLMIRQQVQEQLKTQDPECDGTCGDPEGEAYGMPQMHQVSGREFGAMVRTMARSGPGAMAMYIHAYRLNCPVME
jgi:hypothetical protein